MHDITSITADDPYAQLEARLAEAESILAAYRSRCSYAEAQQEPFPEKTPAIRGAQEWAEAAYGARHVRLAGIPKRFHFAAFRHLYDDNEIATKLRKALVDIQTPSLVLLNGTPGTGKTVAGIRLMVTTFLARHWQRPYMANPPRMRYVNAWELSRSSWNSDIWNSVKDDEVVMIDDVGIEYQDTKGFMASQIAGVMNHRHQHQRLLIVTSNMGDAELSTYFGERIVDRFSEDAILVSITGKSQRGVD